MVRVATATVGSSGAVAALAATGWGLAVLLGMLFVLALLVLCSEKCNRLARSLVAEIKGRRTDLPSLDSSKTPRTAEVEQSLVPVSELVIDRLPAAHQNGEDRVVAQSDRAQQASGDGVERVRRRQARQRVNGHRGADQGGGAGAAG